MEKLQETRPLGRRRVVVIILKQILKKMMGGRRQDSGEWRAVLTR